jgi:hypothetical protein
MIYGFAFLPNEKYGTAIRTKKSADNIVNSAGFSHRSQFNVGGWYLWRFKNGTDATYLILDKAVSRISDINTEEFGRHYAH